eukprot:6810910-Ditylum_brightwellii.AAC.1
MELHLMMTYVNDKDVGDNITGLVLEEFVNSYCQRAANIDNKLDQNFKAMTLSLSAMGSNRISLSLILLDSKGDMDAKEEVEDASKDVASDSDK